MTHKKSYPIRKSNQIALIFSGNIYIIPTPQIALQTKQFCSGSLSCGISIIHFVLYCTWLLMLRYHFVSTFDNELCNLWRQCVPGGLLISWYYGADWGGCQEKTIINDLQHSLCKIHFFHHFQCIMEFHNQDNIRVHLDLQIYHYVLFLLNHHQLFQLFQSYYHLQSQ